MSSGVGGLPANNTPATWPSGHRFNERFHVTALIIRGFSWRPTSILGGPGLRRVVSQILQRRSREGGRRAVDYSMLSALATGNGRVRGS